MHFLSTKSCTSPGDLKFVYLYLLSGKKCIVLYAYMYVLMGLMAYCMNKLLTYLLTYLLTKTKFTKTQEATLERSAMNN